MLTLTHLNPFPRLSLGDKPCAEDRRLNELVNWEGPHWMDAGHRPAGGGPPRVHSPPWRCLRRSVVWSRRKGPAARPPCGRPRPRAPMAPTPRCPVPSSLMRQPLKWRVRGAAFQRGGGRAWASTDLQLSFCSPGSLLRQPRVTAQPPQALPTWVVASAYEMAGRFLGCN